MNGARVAGHLASLNPGVVDVENLDFERYIELLRQGSAGASRAGTAARLVQLEAQQVALRANGALGALLEASDVHHLGSARWQRQRPSGSDVGPLGFPGPVDEFSEEFRKMVPDIGTAGTRSGLQRFYPQVKVEETKIEPFLPIEKDSVGCCLMLCMNTGGNRWHDQERGRRVGAVFL